MPETNKQILEKFIELIAPNQDKNDYRIQISNSIDMSWLHYNKSLLKYNEDLIFTFFEYLKSHCIVRMKPSMSKINVYVFSEIGKKRLSNKQEYDSIINDFLDQHYQI